MILDDAMRANLIDIDQIYEIKYFKNIINKIYNKYKNIEKSMLVNVNYKDQYQFND